MFTVSCRLQLKQMLKSRPFFISLTFATAFVLGATCIDLFSFLHNDRMYFYPAWYYWGINGISLASSPGLYGYMDSAPVALNLLFMLFLPFIASLAFAYVHVDNVKSGAVKPLMPLLGRKAYYRSSAFTVCAGAFW